MGVVGGSYPTGPLPHPARFLGSPLWDERRFAGDSLKKMGVWIWVIDTECRLCERTAPMQAVGFFTEIVQEMSGILSDTLSGNLFGKWSDKLSRKPHRCSLLVFTQKLSSWPRNCPRNCTGIVREIVREIVWEIVREIVRGNCLGNCLRLSKNCKIVRRIL